MTLTRQVAQAVIEAKTANSRQVRMWFPDVAEALVRGALRAACEYGWIRESVPAGRGRNATPAEYEGCGLKRRRSARVVQCGRITSVWDLACDRTVTVRQMRGRRYQPLGQW